MARPLRILVAGGWYHVTARGNRREALYRNEADSSRDQLNERMNDRRQ